MCPRDFDATQLAKFAPSESASISDSTANFIREAILMGRFQPMQRLVQVDIAEMLGVSRQPVREAFRRLEAEGLIVPHSRGGALVRKYSGDEIRENYKLRMLLEAHAAAEAARRCSVADIEELRAINAALGEAADDGNYSRVVELNTTFHAAIRALAHMPVLSKIVDQLWVGYSVITPLFVEGRAARSAREHDEVIQGLADADAEAAFSALSKHIQAGLTDYEAEQGSESKSRRDPNILNWRDSPWSA